MGHNIYNDDKETKLLQSWFKNSKSFMIICQKIRLGIIKSKTGA